MPDHDPKTARLIALGSLCEFLAKRGVDIFDPVLLELLSKLEEATRREERLRELEREDRDEALNGRIDFGVRRD